MIDNHFSDGSSYEDSARDNVRIIELLEEMTAKMPARRRGLGILDWVKGSFLFRSLEILGTIAIILGVTTFMINMEDVKHDRDARAWRLLTGDAPGNSGKIEALEYFNKHNPLAVPNPRRWGIPLGPKAEMKNTYNADGLPTGSMMEVPEEWILIANYGPWKSRTNLTGIDLSRKSDGQNPKYLREIQIPGALLHYANLSGADLRHANLSGAWLNGAKLVRADLTGADLSNSVLWGTNLSSATLVQANLNGVDLQQADLSDAFLLGARLSGASLRKVNFTDATLWKANLSSANLAGANLSGTDLREANLEDTKWLNQKKLNKTCAEGAKLPDGLVPPLPCKREMFGRLIRDEEGNPIRLIEEQINPE